MFAILQSEHAEKVEKKRLRSPNQMKNKGFCINDFELGADISIFLVIGVDKKILGLGRENIQS